MSPGRRRRVTRSIRFRVTAAAAVAVVAVLSVVGVGLVQAQRAELTDTLDETLASQAAVLADRHASAGAVDEQALLTEDVVVRVTGRDGTVVQESPGAQALPPPGTPTAATTLRTVRLPDERQARLLTRSVGGVTIQVAAPLEDVEESTAALVAALAVGVPAAAVLLAGVVWWSVGRALGPVEGLRAEVERITAADLDRRVPEPATGDEVDRLAATMNSMLARLEAAADRQRRFVADASHELRSPLTRIRAELEVDLAYPESADAVRTARNVLEETVGLQRLVDDLLLLAQADAGALDEGQREAVDLDEIAHRHASLVRRLGRVGVDTSAVAAVQAQARRDLVDRAVGNLVENAARHARTLITVTVGRDPTGRAVLTVSDDGPGIPADRVDYVFERFSRLDEARAAAAGGAGLGLAIAREAAQRCGGTLDVDPDHRPGARLVLTLPPTA